MDKNSNMLVPSGLKPLGTFVLSIDFRLLSIGKSVTLHKVKSWI